MIDILSEQLQSLSGAESHLVKATLQEMAAKGADREMGKHQLSLFARYGLGVLDDTTNIIVSSNIPNPHHRADRKASGFTTVKYFSTVDLLHFIVVDPLFGV